MLPVEPRKPSRTAMGAAYFRAAHRRLDAPPWILGTGHIVTPFLGPPSALRPQSEVVMAALDGSHRDTCPADFRASVARP